MRLPGSVLQGILARAALVLLRIYVGVVFVTSGWDQMPGGLTPLLPAAVSWGELMLGVALLVGFLTRFSAAVVLVLAVNAMILGADGTWSPATIHAALAAISIALLIGAAGRTAGVDAALARRWPRSPFW